MALNPTERYLDSFKINKFRTKADFETALAQQLIGNDELSIIVGEETSSSAIVPRISQIKFKSISIGNGLKIDVNAEEIESEYASAGINVGNKYIRPIMTNRINFVIPVDNQHNVVKWMVSNGMILESDGTYTLYSGDYPKFCIRFDYLYRNNWRAFFYVPLSSSYVELGTHCDANENLSSFTFNIKPEFCNTMKLLNALFSFYDDYGGHRSYYDIMMRGSGNGVQNSALFGYGQRTVYISGLQRVGAPTYALQNASVFNTARSPYYETYGLQGFNDYRSLTYLPTTNRFSATIRATITTPYPFMYDENTQTVERIKRSTFDLDYCYFNLVLGMTKKEDGWKTDGYGISVYSGANLVFIRGKKTKGRIPF